MTNPNGKIFFSYSHEQKDIADTFVPALRDHGIPIWRDESGGVRLDHLERQVRDTLRNPRTAGSILLVSEDFAESEFIQGVELPEIENRVTDDEEFFVAPVLCPDVEYDEAKDFLDHSPLSRLKGWYFERLEDTSYEATAAVAENILRQRLETIDDNLPVGQPLSCCVNTYRSPPNKNNYDIALDWSHYFEDKLPSSEIWEERLLPVSHSVVESISEYSPNRQLQFEGQAHLPATFLVGQNLIPPKGIKASWKQETRPGEFANWELGENQQEDWVDIDIEHNSYSESHLAVLLNITQNTEIAIKNTSELPEFNTVLRFTPSQEDDLPLTQEQARYAAELFRTEIHNVVNTRSNIDTIHLFMAVPDGLAFLFGQQTNTLRPIQTYVYDEDNNQYQEAALISS